MANNKYRLFICLLLALCQFSSCKKAANVSKAGTFIKTYQTDSSAESVTLEQMADGGFIIVSTEGAGRPLLIRTDKSGNLRWQKVIQKYRFPGPLNPNQGTWNAFNTKDPGHFLAQYNGTFTLLDTFGNINDTAGINAWNFGVMIQDGQNYIAPFCNGQASGAPSVNKIYVFDNNLKQQRVDSFPDSTLGGKTLGFFLNSISLSGDYVISGTKFPRKYWAWGNPTKIFAAKISASGKAIETIIDSGDKRYSDGVQWSTNTSDSGILLLCLREDNGPARWHPLVIKMDKNLNVAWQYEFPVGNSSSRLYNMTLCSDGGAIMVGQIGNTAYQNNQPYVLRIDQNGNKLWEKTFSASGNSVLYYARELNDGSYAFLGSSNGFGNQLLGTRILFIKTDANGNL